MLGSGRIMDEGQTIVARRSRILSLHHAPDEVAAKTRRIYEAVLARSENIRTGNFIEIGTADLRLLFELYDHEFFSGLLRRMLRAADAGEVVFRLSDRMTRAAGKTTRCRRRVRSRAGVEEQIEYEIAVSTLLLFQSFRDPRRLVTVGGVACRDRLEALQRTFEHELLHLVEFLAWGVSSCSAENYQCLSRRIFAHEGVRHDLVTPREIAATTYRVRVGDLVRFALDGQSFVGRVNRITKRATVLVEDAAGIPYSDGKCYATYYVPLALLRKVDGSRQDQGGRSIAEGR